MSCGIYYATRKAQNTNVGKGLRATHFRRMVVFAKKPIILRKSCKTLVSLSLRNDSAAALASLAFTRDPRPHGLLPSRGGALEKRGSWDCGAEHLAGEGGAQLRFIIFLMS